MKLTDINLHTQGQAVFLDDMTLLSNSLYASVFCSSTAHAKISKLNIQEALKLDGVKAVLTSKDIPGENQIGGIIQDEELLADKHIHFAGQPIALIIADNAKTALTASKKIKLDLEPLPVIIDPREAYINNHVIGPIRTLEIGAVDKVWNQCDCVIEGSVDSGGQEHYYLERQGCIAVPLESGGFKLYSSTQAPTAVQKAVCKVLGLPMNEIEVEVNRLGGAFGGKEDQANPWAALAALGAYHLGKPVKLTLNRHEDIRYTGKRHPYSSDFKIGLTTEGQIYAYEVTFYQNSGAAADLSTAIMERTLYHTTNSYYIPNVKTTGICCQTNLPPFTAFRGFGAPQAMFVIETAIARAAEKLQMSSHTIQKMNLLKEGDVFPYGMAVKNCRLARLWQEAEKQYNFDNIYEQCRQFNKENKAYKKGVAVMPVSFGVSFTNTMMNQAGALVHVYSDGSVGVSTGAIEMGQGVNMKMILIAARVFSISSDRIKVENTNTTRVANTSPTAASSGADLNGQAVFLACGNILERLKRVAANELSINDINEIEIKDEVVCVNNQKTDLNWLNLILKAFQARTNLSSQAHYATPSIHYDKTIEKGEPFRYHAYGIAITQVTLDCIRGTYDIDFVKIFHDVGKSINPLIDQGQIEGGLLQGIGWMTIEELLYHDDGQLITNNSSTYKIPDIKFTPQEVEVHLLTQAENPYAVLNSKAIGEPPFMYGIGCYFAIINAMQAFRPDMAFRISSPLTPEKVLTELYKSKS